MTAIPASPALPAFRQRGWLQSPGWDLFWMFSALWGGALLLAGAVASPLMELVLLGVAAERALSVAHSWSTTWMVVGSSLLAEERRARPVRFRLVPAALAALALGLGLAVAAGQRYPADGRVTPALWIFGLYLALFWVGHFWHFGNQDFGVLTIYRHRAGGERWIDRRIDKLYTVAMMFLIQPVVYVALVHSNAFSEMVRALIPLSPELAGQLATGAVVCAVALGVAALAFELSKPHRSPPRFLYLLVILAHPVLLYAAVRSGRETLALLYIVSYLWSHWFIAVGLVGRINARYYRSRGDDAVGSVLRHIALLGTIVGVVFLLTQRHGEYALFNTSGFRYKELLAAITPEQAPVIGLVLGFFLGEQLVHYWCDRCLFRFRDAAVRRKVAPLLLGEDATHRGRRP